MTLDNTEENEELFNQICDVVSWESRFNFRVSRMGRGVSGYDFYIPPSVSTHYDVYVNDNSVKNIEILQERYKNVSFEEFQSKRNKKRLQLKNRERNIN